MSVPLAFTGLEIKGGELYFLSCKQLTEVLAKENGIYGIDFSLIA